MQYTQNYHLPQWVKEDRIMMEDFNQMCQDIENGMTTSDGKAESAVATANNAMEAAQALPYVVGTYKGTGEKTPAVITVGFRPSFVIFSAQGWGERESAVPPWRFGFIGPSGGMGQITDTGFKVQGSLVYPYPYNNQQDVVYSFIAFK